MNIRISTKGKRPLRSLTPSDKVHAIQRIHDGESKASVARDIGVPESTLRGWCKNEDKLRFMSRQAAAEKFGTDSMPDKLNGNATNILGGPPEKRQRLDASMALNFSNKIKFERASLNGLDFGNNKGLVDMGSFSNMSPEYGIFNGSSKKAMYGADITRSADPSIAAISPLSSLTHLSGLTGLNQSPLAISFNELTTNLTLLAQLNPNLASMSGLNGLSVSGSAIRGATTKSKPQANVSSPRAETSERPTGLTVKNWAKQSASTPTGSDSMSCGLNLSQSEEKQRMKSPASSLAIPNQMGANMPLSSISEDPLLYWLKSQQAALGLNNIYPHTPQLGANSPPIRSSTPQQPILHVATPPIIPNPLTPSSTPSGSLDDKNSAWFNWCKAFGVSFNSLTPAAVVSALQTNTVHNSSNTSIVGDKSVTTKLGFDNILYSQLTKEAEENSPQSCLSGEHLNTEMSNRPEDLSAKSSKTKSPSPTPVPSPSLADHSNPGNTSEVLDNTSESAALPAPRNSVADCKDVLDNLLYKINSTSNAPSRMSDSDASYLNDPNDVTDYPHNNNNTAKPDEEEWGKCNEQDYQNEIDADSKEAIKYGERFLQWLENCSNPRVTAVQLMQLRFLISSVKGSDEIPPKTMDLSSSPIDIDASVEDANRCKPRRRK